MVALNSGTARAERERVIPPAFIRFVGIAFVGMRGSGDGPGWVSGAWGRGGPRAGAALETVGRFGSAFGSRPYVAGDDGFR
jgi:hypothetical protein